MKKPQRLQVIIDLNVKNEEKALQELGVVQVKKRQLEAELDSLQHYLKEYTQQYQVIVQSGINITQLIERRVFMNKLAQGIEEQQQLIQQTEEQFHLVKRNWERQHQKTQSLKKLCEAALAEELMRENRQEQKEQDEQAIRKGRVGGIRNA